MISLLDSPRTDVTVAGILADIHERWMDQIIQFLAPVLSEDAGFWNRWTGARFVNDQFDSRFRLECALVETLSPMLSPGAMATIAAARTKVGRIAEELTMAGRHRASGVLTAHLARRLIDQVALWCIEVELATDGIHPAGLPLPASRLLTHLRTATGERRVDRSAQHS